MTRKYTLDKKFRAAVAQLNPTMGDISGNLALAREAYQRAKSNNANILIFTELFICGYPPEDLVLRPSFTTACEDALNQLALETENNDTAIVIGCPIRRDSGIYNAVFLLANGKVEAEGRKHDLPNYREFDEKRVFTPGPYPKVFNYNGLVFGAPICEDIWNDVKCCARLADQGATIIFVANGSPFSRGKPERRLEVVRNQAIKSGIPVIYSNQLGGQDELVFDGGSFAVHHDGSIAFQMKHFQAEVSFSDWQFESGQWICKAGPTEALLQHEEADYCACVLGFGDYVNKNGFKNVVIGLSGGIDSALCAIIAVDALGSERVHAVMLPYRYTSKESLVDAQRCAELLKCRFDTIPIFDPVEGFQKALKLIFKNTKADVTEENLQSRARGTILMAVSNKFGSMVVTTGNKSEMSVGYATLYGDMNGGFNPIKDLYKMQVYALAKWRNTNRPAIAKGPKGEVIPLNIIEKAPSAELREHQKDQDTLPPYPVLDDILECLVDRDMSVREIISRGHSEPVVKKIERLLYLAEYKRRQSAPGVKVSHKYFGRDRRYPITNHFRDKE